MQNWVSECFPNTPTLWRVTIGAGFYHDYNQNFNENDHLLQNKTNNARNGILF